MSDETDNENGPDIFTELEDGCVYEGATIGPNLAGTDIALTMVRLPVTHIDFPTWLRDGPRRKAQRANYLLNIQLQAREEGDDYWTHLGHFGSIGDSINYDWFNMAQVRELMPWLAAWSEQIGFCAPCPGFTCHRDAPQLP